MLDRLRLDDGRVDVARARSSRRRRRSPPLEREVGSWTLANGLRRHGAADPDRRRSARTSRRGRTSPLDVAGAAAEEPERRRAPHRRRRAAHGDGARRRGAPPGARGVRACPPAAVGLVRSPDHEGARVLVSHAVARPARDPARQRRRRRRSSRGSRPRTACARSRTRRAAACSTCTRRPSREQALALAAASLDRLGVCNRLNLALVDRAAAELLEPLLELFRAHGLEVRGEGGLPLDAPLGHEWASDPERVATVTVALVDGLERGAADRERRDLRPRRRDRHRGRRGGGAFPRRLPRHRRVLARADAVHRRLRADRRAGDRDQRRRRRPARAGRSPTATSGCASTA